MASAKARFLFVTWDGGGNLHPSLGLARMLSERGHNVRMLVWGSNEDRVEAAGCVFRPLGTDLRFDAEAGPTWEEQGVMSMELFYGSPIAREVLSELDRESADVLVADAFLVNALAVGEVVGCPTALLMHVRFGYLDEWVTDRASYASGLQRANETRVTLGLAPIAELPGSSDPDPRLLARGRPIVLLPREFEDPGCEPPSDAIYVGPIFEERLERIEWDPPWSPSDGRPLVLVAFSSTYMRQEDALSRVLHALDPLPVRILLTLGSELEADHVPAGRWEVRRHVPHVAVMPSCDLVVTHAGMGTVNAAMACGVPMLCAPMGRDQDGNAARVANLKLGRSLPAHATAQAIRAEVEALLASEDLRARTRRMAKVVATYGEGAGAVAALEGLLG